FRKAGDLQKIKPGHRRAKEIQEQYGRYGAGGGMRGLRRDRRKGSSVGEGSWIPWAAIAFGLVVFGVVLWSVTIYLKVGEAVVKVTINDPDVKVTLQGTTVSVEGARQPLKVSRGDG